MSTKAPEQPIAPGLFNLVRRYAKQLAASGLPKKDPLRRDATIVVFCQTFFQQFFATEFEYEIEAVDQESKREAARLRVEAAKADTHKEALALVRSFEDLCDMWPDVLGFTYGGVSSEFRRFHVKYVPTLLDRITRWAASAGLEEIASAANDSLAEWTKAAKKWTSPIGS